MKKRILSIFTTLAMLCSFIGVMPTIEVGAAGMTLTQLQAKFPAGKYWNHAGSNTNNPDGYTSTPCNHHGPYSVNCSVYGTCGCNCFSNCIQCMGFAFKLGYDAFGSNPLNSWATSSEVNSLKAGDVVRYLNDGHSIFITAVNGENVTFGDCNYDEHCIIRWGATTTKSNIRATLTRIYVAPSTLVTTPTHTHSYTGKATKDATCTAEGVQTYTCSCGNSYTKPLPALGHDYKSNVVQPKCETKGYTHYQCSRCSSNYNNNEVAAKGHSWKEKSRKNATCTAKGEVVSVCTVCSKTKTDTLNMLNHNITTQTIKPKCEEKGYTLDKCSKCNYSKKYNEVSATGHSWKEKSRKNATCTAKGEVVSACSVCGYTKTNTLNALGHNYKDTVIAPTYISKGYTKHNCQRCGHCYDSDEKPIKIAFDGKGTKDAPYQITNAEKLRLLSELLNSADTAAVFNNKYYVQTDDIDLNNELFVPIGAKLNGDYAGSFQGEYNGQKHKIINLNINGDLKYTGLFAWCSNAAIKNLNVYGNVKGAAPTGGIVGELNSNPPSSIENCSFTGKVSSSGTVGGIAGDCWVSGSVTNCLFNGTVYTSNESSPIGGIVGGIGDTNSKGQITIKNCYAVSDGEFTNGVVGKVGTVNNESVIEISDNSYMDNMFKGNGTKDEPYQIATAENLRQMSDLINNPLTASDFRGKYYIQTKDIDLENKLFIPIGITDPSAFWGVYDGQNHKIINLNVDTDANYAGLFAYGYNVTIKNISLYGKVKGNTAVGGIVGNIGSNRLSRIENCSFNGTLSASGTVGGIVGQSWHSCSITNCYFNGSIITRGDTAASGGIISLISTWDANKEDQVIIKKCYSVSDSKVMGGIVNRIDIKNEKSTIDISNNFYLNNMAETGGYDSGCQALSAEGMKTASVIKLGTPFVENNNSDINDGYPIFEWQADYKFKGKGTDESPYLITSKKEFEIFRDLTNSEYLSEKYNKASYLLTTDIDLDNEKWTPISKRFFDGVDKLRVFQGNFNGGYHTIKGLNVDENSKFAGLFGCASHGIIENLMVEGDVISTSTHVGGIVGEIGDEIIRNCCFIGDVKSGEGGAIGGILGYLWQIGSVENCYHIGKVTSGKDNSGGGLIGRIQVGEQPVTAIIKNSYHVGSVTGGYVGNIVGYMDGNGKNNAYISIQNCYTLDNDIAIAGGGTAKDLDVTKLKSDSLKKSAELISDVFVNNSDSEFNSGYPVFKWQLKNDVTGDANNDREVNVSDVVMVQKWLTNKAPITNSSNADLNSDGKVDVFDIILLKRIVMKG